VVAQGFAQTLQGKAMAREAEIDLVGELLPVGLLRCKDALEHMDPQDVLCVCTDDFSLVEHVAKFIRPESHRVLRGLDPKGDRPYRIHILKI
jgi:TusA-related sulfurtransferase